MKCPRCGLYSKDRDNPPDYQFGSPRERILKYLAAAGMSSKSQIMYDTKIAGLYHMWALDDLVDENKVRMIETPGGAKEFTLR